MSFYKKGKRTGKIWKDLLTFDKIIRNNEFSQRAKREKDYGFWLSGLISANKSKFSSIVKSETNKTTKVKSIFCFGKSHRPDMAIGEDSIVIELKFINTKGKLDELKQAIGQLMIYRLTYKFGILIIILSKEHKKLYYNIVKEKSERDFEEILNYLSNELNIYTYIIPDFKLSVGVPKIYKTFNKV